ncbi:hypothetical protein FCM35_KLT00023 [Carex littledalei]|uniref:Uncharacterized protein n=1 Tax=Carex littledalei TaxID=544730 RepID=A0A833VTA1_9POAL|nr:hypothetical protein FCM35_KLT00023 [Carex littledalei]
MQATYLAPETSVKGYVLKNTDDMSKSILSKNEQSKYFTGSKDGSTEEYNQEEMKYRSIKGWRKLIVVSETKAKSNRESSHGGHNRKRGRGIDIDYDPPKTHPPSHN